ncbi:MAG TPA: (2Fe-2S)-binding protein [Pyrinomonadaceae bacterium]|nr:(2Fe-2S)-binding protein [Pyrinomonadaceae bacterium]
MPKNVKRASKDGVTRRGFLKGAGLTAAGAALADAVARGATASARDEALEAEAKVAGPGAVAVALKVNGTERRLSVEPRATLAEVLRFELGLTGTKVVCDRGSCSACTVWLDKVPVCSCMTLALDVGPRAVTTIEGLAPDEATLHPVQQAFIEYDALQCGFCTPGMIMSCAALVERKPDAALEDVRAATSGNLCRCGTYPKVFEATLAAAARKSRAPGKKGGDER